MLDLPYHQQQHQCHARSGSVGGICLQRSGPLTNHWENLFADRSAVIEGISDAEILAYIREDNYTPLREALAARTDYPGWRPDLDFNQGFDQDGFAADGSWWRAFRYKPFLGTFWPT